MLVSNNIIRFITFPVVSLYTIRSASFYVSVNTISGFIKCIIKFNVRDKRAQQTSERNTFHFPTIIILNYITIILGNNYN